MIGHLETQLVWLYPVCIVYCLSLDVPFINGQSILKPISFNSLDCSGIQSDTGIHMNSYLL